MGRDGLGLPVRTRRRPRRADVRVHALQVHEEFFPCQRSGHRRADREAPAGARPGRTARDRQEARGPGVRPGAEDVDAPRLELRALPSTPEKRSWRPSALYYRLWLTHHPPTAAPHLSARSYLTS